jgi:hypothetical protein
MAVDKGLKVALAILLLLCLLDMPYGFYQLVRFVSMVGFGYFAFSHEQSGQRNFAIVFGVAALLFQPFIKISLGRELWNIVDVVMAIIMVVSIFKKSGPEAK